MKSMIGAKQLVGSAMNTYVGTTAPGALVGADSNRALLVKTFLPPVVGGAAGYFLWKKHPVLGLLGGAAVGNVAGPVTHGDYGKLTHLVPTAAGVFASLKYRKHPALSFIAAELAVRLLMGYTGMMK